MSLKYRIQSDSGRRPFLGDRDFQLYLKEKYPDLVVASEQHYRDSGFPVLSDFTGSHISRQYVLIGKRCYRFLGGKESYRTNDQENRLMDYWFFRIEDAGLGEILNERLHMKEDGFNGSLNVSFTVPSNRRDWSDASGWSATIIARGNPSHLIQELTEYALDQARDFSRCK